MNRSGAFRAWWMIAVFVVVAAVSYTDRLILSLLIAPIGADLALTDTQLGIVQGLAFAIIYAFAGLPFGRLADLIPRRNVIIAGVVIWSLATLASGLATGFWTLFISRMCVGIGEAAFAPAAVSMIADHFPPERRGLAIGCLLTGMAAGSGAAIIVGGGMLDLAAAGTFVDIPVLGGLAPWRTVLVVLGLAGLVPILLLLTVREPVRGGGRNMLPSVPFKAVVSSFASAWKLLVPLYIAVALIAAADSALQNWTPVMLERQFGYSGGDLAATLGPVSLGIGCAGTLLGGWVSDRLGRRGGDRRRLALALAAVALGAAGCGIGFSGHPHLSIALFGLWLFSSSISGTVGITVLQNVIPSEIRGIGTAMVSFCNVILGLGVGTALPGLVTDKVYGTTASVGLSISTVMIPCAMIAFLLFARARTRLRPGAGTA